MGGLGPHTTGRFPARDASGIPAQIAPGALAHRPHGALGHPLARGTLPGSPGPPTSRRCNGYTLADSEYSNGENIMDFGDTWDSEAEFEGMYEDDEFVPEVETWTDVVKCRRGGRWRTPSSLNSAPTTSSSAIGRKYLSTISPPISSTPEITLAASSSHRAFPHPSAASVELSPADRVF